MSVITVFLSALFFTLVGMAYVKGYDIVKKHSPEHIAHFYLLLTALRFLLIGMAVVFYAFVVSKSREETLDFAVMFLGMYAVMMVITLILKH